MSHAGVRLGFGNLHGNVTGERAYAGEVQIAEPAGRLGPGNPGDGAPAATATGRVFAAAEQTIPHRAGHPSHITLAVIHR